MSRPRTILITGCSEGSLGDALAREFQRRGQRVFATGRNPAKLSHFQDLGIDALTIDVVSRDSIFACAEAVAQKTGGSLDMLINNAGGGYTMPVLDSDPDIARGLFDLNVIGMLSVTQAFVPLLLKSEAGAVIANNTSIASVIPKAMGGVYHASKAAAAMLSDTLRLELSPFNIKVVDLKTGITRSAFFDNQSGGARPSLPDGSLYRVARDLVERAMSVETVEDDMMAADQWAREVADELLRASPPARIWKGGKALATWVAVNFFPAAFLEGQLMKLGGLDAVKRRLGGVSS